MPHITRRSPKPQKALFLTQKRAHIGLFLVCFTFGRIPCLRLHSGPEHHAVVSNESDPPAGGESNGSANEFLIEPLLKLLDQIGSISELSFIDCFASAGCGMVGSRHFL